ncbi:hypothetical protein [uncultured Lamprocystis sp.]|jgi:serine acetyltransferase|uniref:hypothetical protein n=1 Tax=uncultured Lamprocystis sp. TaxID=543132 RepID=UPI0025EA1C50|nr:hypothetical protein [uncultured Lamprocystis sp.]
MMTQSLREIFIRDFQRYHGNRYPGRCVGVRSTLRILFGSPGFITLVLHRLTRYGMQTPARGAVRWIRLLWLGPVRWLQLKLPRAIAKIYITPDTQIGTDIWLSDSGHMIIGAFSLGHGCVIHKRVTIGMAHSNKGHLPRIGSNVWIGSNCLIYGGIQIADGVTILPGTVLSKSVPATGIVLQGNPARVICNDFDNSRLRASSNPDASSFLPDQITVS